MENHLRIKLSPQGLRVPRTFIMLVVQMWGSLSASLSYEQITHFLCVYCVLARAQRTLIRFLSHPRVKFLLQEVEAKTKTT